MADQPINMEEVLQWLCKASPAGAAADCGSEIDSLQLSTCAVLSAILWNAAVGV